MIVNKLKLNADTTDAIVIWPHIELGNMTVPTSTVATNIGVLFDEAPIMKNHVQHIVWHISTFIASATADTYSIGKRRR